MKKSLKHLHWQIRNFFLPPLTLRKVAIVATSTIAIFVSGCVTLVVLVLLGLTGALPSNDELRQIKNPMASEVYSADSVLLGRYFIQERSNIGFKDIPPTTIQALVATEDVRFYKHNGIDYSSLGRVVFKSLLLGDDAGGGSTITQQLVKNLYPRKKYWLLSLPINKIREMVVAVRLERIYSKDEIISLYLNTVPFGENMFGLEAAAQRFFSRSAKQLTTEQSAVLVGMLKATHSYNPRLFPDRARLRRNVVLSQMERAGMLTHVERELLSKEPILLSYNKVTHQGGIASYFREQVRQEVVTWLRAYNAEHETQLNLYTSGLKIYTTLDSKMQRVAEASVKKHMALVQRQFDAHWRSLDPGDKYPTVLEAAVRMSDRYKKLARVGTKHAEILVRMSEPVSIQLFGYDGVREVVMSPIDSIKHHLRFLNTGMIAIDPRQGDIRVWVGGIDQRFFQYDHVKASTKRQVGSTFKPIVFAAALEHGARPCSFVSAEKTVYNNVDDWTPKNSGNENYGLKYSMTGALAYSVNTVSVKILEEAGIDRTIDVARRLGIQGTMEPVPSLALGTAEASLTEMAIAYSAFANGGQAITPRMITEIQLADGTVAASFHSNKTTAVLSKETATLMTHMLRVATQQGTSSALKTRFGLRCDIAGKTGTTQSNTDGWFIGMTPALVVGVWVGGDFPQIRFQSTAQGQGARTALPIVGEFFQTLQKDKHFDPLTYAKFDKLPAALARKVNCPLYKEDRNLFRKLSGRTEQKRDFGATKKNFWKRLFGKE